MKKCPFCMEEIHDKAIKCRQCGTNIGAAGAAAKREAISKKMTKMVGMIWGILGAVVFGLVGFLGFRAGDLKSVAICGGFAVVFFFIAPKAWVVGSSASKERPPTLIIANSQSELMKQQLLLEYGAPLMLVGMLFFLMGFGLTKLVPVEQWITQETQTASTSQAAVAAADAPSASQSEAGQAPVQGQASEAQQPEVRTTGVASDASSVVADPTTANTSTATTADQHASQAIVASVQPASADNVVASASQSIAEQAPPTAQQPAPPTAIVASFDCGKASSRVEKLICSSPQTADSDQRVASAYSAARSKSSDPSALKADQRNWLTTERNACGDAACLTKVMEARIQKLSAM